ncbi:unnamed protein product [Lathyrus sativus]|nr:unnamed protein product [Lathyrus sativus]
MVIQLWIAEGLIPQPKSEESWEKVAEEYFAELVWRSLIRQRPIDDESKEFIGDERVCFEMHDLINDLAMAISSPYCIRLDNYKPDERVEKRVRHLSFDRVDYSSNNRLEKLCGLKGLRTFLPMPLQISWACENSVSSKLFSDLLLTMTQLHVLSLSHLTSMTELPNSIGNLIYLRYLNLSRTQIKTLPSETCKLYNLQTLLLSSCQQLTELPKDVGKLVKLRHLDIRGTKLKKMPTQISKLKSLQTLSDFVVSSVKDVGLKIEDLGKYPHLQGSLSISQLENVTDPSHASQANMEKKKEIDDLELRWSYVTPSNSQIQNVVLERLCPSTNLKSLAISRYGGDKLPNWLDRPFFSNMVRMKISECINCSRLPSLGQLDNLKELFISGMESVKSVDTVFYGSGSAPFQSFQPFTSLETLSFENMPEWEEWKLIGGGSTEFPSLISLSLSDCPKLKENIPINLPKLKHLCVKHCPKLIGITPNNLPSLVDLRLKDCPSLMNSRHSDIFSQLMISLNSLQNMTLQDTPTLTSFPREGLPKTLQSLVIKGCENLEFLSADSFHSYTSLEDLQIHDSCNSMISFTLCSLPALKILKIIGCKHLKSLIISEDASKQNLLCLRDIWIQSCNELESVSLIGLPIPNLTHLSVLMCEKLRSLPESIKTLTSLQDMYMDNLPNLQSFSIDDLPMSLREIRIGEVGEILWNTTSWEHLTSLSALSLSGDDVVKALVKIQVPVLPINIVDLEIFSLEDVECLDGKWLKHLSSLHTLEIHFASNLRSLPEQGDLPSSLKELIITKCPLLEAKLQRKKGKEWRKISHIPSLDI